MADQFPAIAALKVGLRIIHDNIGPVYDYLYSSGADCDDLREVLRETRDLFSEISGIIDQHLADEDDEPLEDRVYRIIKVSKPS